MMRRRGITVGTVDCLISRLAMRHDWPLLTTDRDFERIAAVMDLRLEQV
jgi:predicted nucleic acid-binding protein